MTDTHQNPLQLNPHVYIVHERFYVTNISQIPVPTYDGKCLITQNIIHLARGPRVLYNVFTLYHGSKGIESALHKIAEALKPGKHEPWYPGHKFTLAPRNLARQKVVSRDKLANISWQSYNHMDIPGPCLTLYDMPNGYMLPYPPNDNIIYQSIHAKCTNMVRIAYYKIDYKLFVSQFIVQTYLDNLILNRYYLRYDPLYIWIRKYWELLYLYIACKNVKVGSTRLNYTKQELVDIYTEATGREPKWYHRMFPNWLMADTCRLALQTKRYDALIQHADTVDTLL